MTTYGFSASTASFYLLADQEGYEKYGNWPDDVQAVTDAVWDEFSKQGPNGKVRGADEKGTPCWVDAPPLTHEQQIFSAERRKQTLLDNATAKISIWQTKLLMGRKLAADELSQLNAWMDYIDAVTAVDTSAAPDIEWPDQPTENPVST